MASRRRLAALRQQLLVNAPAGARQDDHPASALLTALEDAGADTDLPTIGWDEIVTHNSRDDLWVVVDGVVYDMTEFIGLDHP